MIKENNNSPDNKANFLIIAAISLIWLTLVLALWLGPSKDLSESERRPLAQAPHLDLHSLSSGNFMRDLEEYAKDQFPARFAFRSLKAFTRLYLLRQLENNNIYLKEGYAVKLEYPLNENSIEKANQKFRWLYEKYLVGKDVRIFISVIPDKNYFLATGNGYPTMDYERMFSLVKEANDFASFIDISKRLDLEDYYRTDIHWRQESIVEVARTLAKGLGVLDSISFNFDKIESTAVFNGVYSSQIALPLKPDRLFYLVNQATNDSQVYNLETDEYTPVYDLEKLAGKDPYDLYLSGATPLLIIENPSAKNQKELVVFRDSYGSSIVPLLLEAYAKVTLIDIRYISSSLLGDYIDFSNQDVLFLYNALLLNSSTMLK